MARHDPASPLLVGQLMPQDRIHDAKQALWRDDQVAMLI